MPSEGLPVNNVVGTSVELGARSTADAANTASSSQAADSAATSADRAWKFSKDAATSAVEAKVSEINASAVMSSALSKVTTIAQSVASAVTFNQNVTVQGNLYSGSVKVATKAMPIGTSNLRDFKSEGEFYQHSSSNATPDRNYPVALAGTLKVLEPKASQNGRYTCNQIYYPFSNSNYYLACHYAAFNDTWSDWERYDSRSGNDLRYLQIGAYGLGADFRPSLTGYTLASDYRINGAWYANISTITDTFDAANNHIFNVSGHVNRSYCFQLAFPLGVDKMAFRRIQNNGVGAWKELWSTANTTVDANGFLKKASPIVKLLGDGSSELNEQSQGVTTERIETGIYRVSGVLGFSGDGAWGGAGNGIEIPVDDNKRPLIWIESKILPDGDIEIRTYHRTYDTGPYSTRNIEVMETDALDSKGKVIKGQKIYVSMPDGEPIDIPAGRWIDLRVEMPAGEEPVYEHEVIEEPQANPEPVEEPSPSESPAPTEEPKE